MTDNTTELKLIKREIQILAEIENLKAEVTETRQERRHLDGDGDAESVQQAQQEYDEALAKVQRLEAERQAAEAGMSALNARLDQGDESVSVDAMVNAEKAVARLATLIKPAKRDLKKADRILSPLLADQQLVGLAADILETVSPVPIIIRRKVENAPAEVTPAVILSQVEPTAEYGTLNASGVVKVTEVGQTGIDWQAVQTALEDTGSEGRATRTQVELSKAWWPVPRLAEPSLNGIGSWMTTFEEAWHLQVAGEAEAKRLREHGWEGRVKTMWGGLFDRSAADLTFSDGKAIGTAAIRVAAQQDNGISMSLDDLRAELTELFSVFREETVGDITPAGEIVSVSMSDVKHSHHEWDKSAVAWRLGEAVQPTTAEATITLEFIYGQA